MWRGLQSAMEGISGRSRIIAVGRGFQNDGAADARLPNHYKRYHGIVKKCLVSDRGVFFRKYFGKGYNYWAKYAGALPLKAL